jgi:hypothetical protein
LTQQKNPVTYQVGGNDLLETARDLMVLDSRNGVCHKSKASASDVPGESPDCASWTAGEGGEAYAAPEA